MFMCYLDRLITITDLVSNSDNGLYEPVCLPNHCLHHLLPLLVVLAMATCISCQIIPVSYTEIPFWFMYC